MMRPSETNEDLLGHMARPRPSDVLRALREARGVTQDGWAAQLGVSRKTVQRWENGERAPDSGAEAAILKFCRERDLLRAYDRGPLAGMNLTAELLQSLLSEARWRVDGDEVAVNAPEEAPAPAPLATLPPAPEAPLSNIPVRLTSFVGREREIAQVRRALGGTRLLTLTGAGGCGKTRLALQVADELLWAYPHGIWFVDLAALADPALTPRAVAAALSLQTTESQPPLEPLIAHLRTRSLLLVIDNCEHLLSACAELVETLLRACPNLEVMTTSREPLGIGGEVVWQVPPLAVPAAEDQGGVSGAASAATLPEAPADIPDSMRLFVERARLYRPGFALTAANTAAVAEICRRLDGMPLAIELAAARVKALSAEQIASRIEDRLRLLTAGSRTALPRHQTLRAALDWSFDLLTPEEQALLRRLAVFAGGWSLEAAESVGGGDQLDTLSSLVDKSLVIVEEVGGEARYRLLETVRHYVSEKLADSDEAVEARNRHLEWYAGFVQSAAAQFRGPHEPAWLARLEGEHDNLRVAFGWALLQGNGESALRLAARLPRFWEMRGHTGEGKRWLEQALAVEGAPPSLRALGLGGAGVLAYLRGDYLAAHAFFEQSLALSLDLGDRQGIAEAQGNLGRTKLRLGDHTEAHAQLEASLTLHVEHGEQAGIADVQFTLGVISLRQGDYPAASARFEASLAINRETGNMEGIANALEELATVLGEQGDDGRQAALLDESLTLYRALGDRSGIASILGHLGTGAWARGDYPRALALLEESLALYREVGDRRGVARLLGNQGLVAIYQHDYARAAALCRESLTLYREAGDTWAVGRYLSVLAAATLGLGQPVRATELFAAATALRERIGASLPPAVRSGHDQAVATARRVLGEDAFAAAWTSGEGMSPEEAVDCGQ